MKSLRVFVLTMEQGSLTLAAQTMNLSQPAASRLLQQLEEEFGAPLFLRDSKTLTPSREAEILYPEASRILSSYEELPSILEALRHDDTMPLKVVGQTRCCLGLVTPALIQLNKEHPEISVDLDVQKRTELRRRAVWDRFDVGVFALPLHLSFAQVRSLKKMPCEVVVAPSHPLAAKPMLTPQDVEAYDYIAVKHATQGRTVIEEALERTGQSLEPKHEVSNAFAAISLVQKGFGFTITDRFTVDPAYLPMLSFVSFSPEPIMEYAVCVSHDSRRHPMSERLVEILAHLMDAA
ncbi:MAG: LysR family transcriptional regulator [Pseudomonadota bacterium]